MEAALKKEAEAEVTVILKLPGKLHQEVLLQACRMGITLQAWIIQAIKSQLSPR